ncbi:type II secretion system protein GspM [Acinetobacter colistiniresistens]|uniref:General secretion pathway protein M n=1 Tax=Acinetobacter colistiniresistens TaxID=280145 RepID=S3T9E5_9GAMM|nr:type II secretion system protein GspM [Acinetobacter colistiniresistens]EPG38141.1 general secretion pathway protein M [Acinetobacter colistiniresistens]TVT86206.1 type II secretion system protein M [Acinetobacter colistiniresistens]
MKALTRLQNSFDQKVEALNEYLQSLSARERVMVIVTAVFVVVAAIGSSLWQMHALADKQQKRLNDLKDITVWMQSNAATMKPANDQGLTAADKIQRTAQQQGLAVSSQQNGEQIQLVAEHQNYAVLANFLMQLSQAGISIQKMDLVSNNNQIKLTATVQ